MTASLSPPGVVPQAPPGIYGLVNLATGPVSGPATFYNLLLVGNFIPTSGSAVAGNIYGPTSTVGLQSTQDAINLFGAGSPLQRAYSVALKNFPQGLYAIPITPAVGNAASITFTVTQSGTESTGNVRVWVGTTYVDTPFGTSDSAATVATNVVNNVNGNQTIDVLASSPTSGAIKLTYKVAGARGNWKTAAVMVTSGTGILVNAPSQSPSVYTGQVKLTGGTGSDLTSYQSATSTLIASGLRFYRQVIEAGCDSIDGYNTSNTANGIVEYWTQNLIDFESNNATIGIRQVLFTGSVDTLGNTITTTSTLNDGRVATVNHHNGNTMPFELAAQWASGIATLQTPFLQAQGVNLDNFGATGATSVYWLEPPALDGSAASPTDIATSVTSGVSIVKNVGQANTCVVKACTTHFYFGSSAQFDPRIVDLGAVTVCDYFLDDLEVDIASKCANKLVQDNPKNGAVIGANVVTPKMIENIANEQVGVYASAGLVNANNTTVTAQISPLTPSRIELAIGLWVNACLHTVTVVVNQNSTNS